MFTDNLDVINRLYFDMLSAEGRNSFGDPDMRRAPEGGLALLRELGTSLFRYNNGQDWRFCQDLQQGLRHRLAIKRVSSQDRGVDSSADVIVATAVLEVGFDDPTVGAVVQHKAPRGMAGFLQRKGRALLALTVLLAVHLIVHPILLSGGVRYGVYARQDERLLGLSALADQHWAAVLMTGEEVLVVGAALVILAWPLLLAFGSQDERAREG